MEMSIEKAFAVRFLAESAKGMGKKLNFIYLPNLITFTMGDKGHD